MCSNFRFVLVWALLMMVSGPALAHVGAPAVRQVRFPDQRPEAVWIVVLNVGLLVPEGDNFRWLCDEAITVKPGFNDMAPLDADGIIWVAATRFGLYRTLDSGCSFEPLEGILSQHEIRAIYPNPAVPGEALIVTQTITLDDDVYITTDAGETWTPAGLNLLWPVHNVFRSPADPQRVYAIHPEGAVRSDDGGRSFVEMAFAPPDDDALAEDVRVLGTDPANADIVYASIDRLPEAHFIRSDDGGVSWVLVSLLEDIPDTLIISPTDGSMLLSLPFVGVRRSADGGQSWSPVALLEDNQSVSCMFADPEGGIWACALGDNQFVIRSEDFGESWTSVFTRDFTQVTSSWACAEDTKTAEACSMACDRAVEDCGDQPMEEDATMALPMEDAGLDAGLDTSVDLPDLSPNPPLDSEVLSDSSSPMPPASRQDDGCQTSISGIFPWPLVILFLLVAVLRARSRQLEG